MPVSSGSAFTFAGQYGAQQALNTNGALLKKAAVSVFVAGTTTLASLFTDRSKATPAANPTATDALGNLLFFADPGRYDVSCSGSTLTVVVPMDPAEASDQFTSVQTVSGSATVTVGGSVTNPVLSVPAGVFDANGAATAALFSATGRALAFAIVFGS